MVVTTSDRNFGVTGDEKQITKTLRFTPTDDAFAWEKKPNNNYGNSEELRVRKTSRLQVAFMRFELLGLNGILEKAKLRLLCVDGSEDGGTIYEVPSNWSEGKIDWNNAPALSGSLLASLGPVKAGQTVEVDLTTLFKENGVYAFAIKNASSDVLIYSSKEGAQAPELIITTNSTPTPVAAAKFTHNSVTGLQTNLPTLTTTTELTLWPNYPNPFNLETTFTYSLPEAAAIELSIYNIRGQKVRTVVSDFLPAGLHTVRWNGQTNHHQEASSGVYVVILQVEGSLLNKKVILLK